MADMGTKEASKKWGVHSEKLRIGAGKQMTRELLKTNREALGISQ